MLVVHSLPSRLYMCAPHAIRGSPYCSSILVPFGSVQLELYLHGRTGTQVQVKNRNGARLTSTKVDSKEGLVLARTKKCRAGWSLMDSDVEASSVLVECRVLAVHRRDVLVQHLTTTPTFLRAIVSSSGLACARWSGTRKLNSLAWAAHLPWPLEAVRGQHGDGLASLVPQAV